MFPCPLQTTSFPSTSISANSLIKGNSLVRHTLRGRNPRVRHKGPGTAKLAELANGGACQRR